jgi:formate dehydrogenase major subunit
VLHEKEERSRCAFSAREFLSQLKKGSAMPIARIIVDGQEVRAGTDQTILDVCRDLGIFIPTLCHDEQLEPIGSCQICVVELEEHGLVTACNTRVADGMVIRTQTDAVVAARKKTLETLLAEHHGDCVAPCEIACPAGIDIQGYLALIARGAYTEAVQLIKQRLPIPGIIGRVCPHPCETACRRNLVDDPLPICALKRFAADHAEEYIPEIAPATGKNVAIIGAGPAGLSAAYYLAEKGHAVTVFESLPKPGGMLRYGIPDYRLPQDILDGEIHSIEKMGVNIKTSRTLGKDFTMESLAADGYDAVFLAIGAHKSSTMRVEGEDLRGVLPGTDFLRSVVLGNPMELGERVAVIGGGNTAIDAARTALRLGAKEVTIVYRRSREEMPATDWEVEEAEEEGVTLHFLAAPTKISGENGHVNSITCIKMKLGEPDDSGRRRPMPIDGSEFVLEVNNVIAAIGQKPDLSPIEKHEEIELKWGNIMVLGDIMLTGMQGVFAGGDCVTGAATAVEAVAGGRKAAVAIDRYLKGEQLADARVAFDISKGRKLEDVRIDEFEQFERIPREKMPALSPEERVVDFREAELGYPEDVARRQASRCLECGCKAAHDCALRDLSAEYGVDSMTVTNGLRLYPRDLSHPFVERDPNKCIACGRCVRICQEVQGAEALSLLYRVTSTGESNSLLDTPCVSCGLCIASCPVGALVAKQSLEPEYEVKTTCPYCGVGCGIYLGIRGGIVVDARGDFQNPSNRGNTCVKGRFGHAFINHPDRLKTPLIKRNGEFEEASWEETLGLIASRLADYKGDQFAALSSARCTSEENYLFQKFSRGVMGTNNIDHCARL